MSGADSSRGGLSPSSSSQLEVVAPVTADVEFKYTWPIDGFVNQVKNGNSSSLSSNGEPNYPILNLEGGYLEQ